MTEDVGDGGVAVVIEDEAARHHAHVGNLNTAEPTSRHPCSRRSAPGCAQDFLVVEGEE